MQGFHVMHQCGAIKYANLRHKGRAQARHAALALDRFNHGAFFATNIGARAAAQIDIARRDDFGRFQRGNFLAQNLQHSGVFIAHVDKAFFRLDRPSSNQHAFQHQMRGALEVIAVFKGARLALVAIHGQIARAWVGAHKAPFFARWKPSAPQPTQARLQQRILHLLPIARGAQLRQTGITARIAIGLQGFIGGHDRVKMAAFHHLGHQLGRGMIYVAVAHFGHGRAVAAAHAGRAQHANLRRVMPRL